MFTKKENKKEKSSAEVTPVVKVIRTSKRLTGGMVLTNEGVFYKGVKLEPTQVYNRLRAWGDDNLVNEEYQKADGKD